MPGTTTSLAAFLDPATVDALFMQPLLASAVATNEAASTVCVIDTESLQIPRVTDDPDVVWLDELEPAPLVDMGADSITAVPKRVAAVSLLSRELVEDSSESAQEEVGAALVRAYGHALDAAYATDGTANGGKQPDGLASFTAGAGATNVQRLAIGTSPTNLDPFEDALAALTGTGATPTAFLMNPADITAYGKLKAATGSNVPLLGADPSQPRRKQISGVPIIPLTSLPAGTHYLVDGGRIRTVIRRDARIETSTHAYFREDGVAVKVSARATFAFPHPQSIVRLVRAAS